MAFGQTYNCSTPAENAESPSQGNDRIREIKEANRERLDVDHYYPENSPTSGLVDDADTGEHRQATLRERADPGTVDEDKAVLYAKQLPNKAADDDKAGVVIIDEDEKIKQLTIRDTSSLCLKLEGKDFTACEADIVDALTIEVSGGKLQLKAGDADNGIQAGHLKTTAKAFCDDETLEIDETNGLQVKTGAFGQSAQASGTNDISTSSGSYVNMGSGADAMNIVMTTSGGPVLLNFTATLRTEHDKAQAGVRLVADEISRQATMWTGAGTGLDETFQDPYKGAHNACVALGALVTLDAGEHTFKVQWRKFGTGTIYQKGATYKRILTAVELPHAVS